MILRRVQLADCPRRAFINDQAISVQTLKAVGSALVEIHGQHDERALVDASTTGGCSTRSPGWRRTSRRWRRCGTPGAPPMPRSTSIAPAWSAPPARRTICAMPPMN
jgi:DNA repair protein RecN (Recombination protein N)